jgi:hypothetical protein
VLLGLALVTSLVLDTPMVAGAKVGPTPMQQYRIELQAYNSYNHASAVLFRNLTAALANDRANEKAALKAAKSPAQRYLVQVDYRETRATDIANWETAQMDLGPQPPLPQLPVVTRPSTTTTTASSNSHPTTTTP